MHHPILNVFSSLKGTSFVTLNTSRIVELSGGKSNPLKGRITKKVSGTNVLISQDRTKSAYHEMIRRRLIAQGTANPDFEPSKRTWGERIKDTPIIQHNDKFYLGCIILREGKSSYFLDGLPIAITDITGLKHEAVTPQFGLEKPVLYRLYSTDSITSLKFKKTLYINGIDF